MTGATAAAGVEGLDFPDRFRAALARFCTGVVVVTAMDEDGAVGFTCQSFSSLSLDPPLVLFCPSKSSTSWPRVKAAGQFCINVLREDQQDLSNRFATSGGPKFDGVSWEVGAHSAPRLVGAIAHIDCELIVVHDGGDHEIAVGRVLDLAHEDEHRPLLYFRSRYHGLSG